MISRDRTMAEVEALTELMASLSLKATIPQPSSSGEQPSSGEEITASSPSSPTLSWTLAKPTQTTQIYNEPSLLIIDPTHQLKTPRANQKLDNFVLLNNPYAFLNFSFSFYPPSQQFKKTQNSIFLFSFSPTTSSHPSLPISSCQVSAMTSTGKENINDESENVNTHLRLLQEAFQAKLTLPPPISKSVSLSSNLWEDLENKGETLVATKILTDELISQKVAFEAIRQAILSITNGVYEKTGILCMKCGRLGHFHEMCSDPIAARAPVDRFRYLLATPLKPRNSPSSQASTSNHEKGVFFRKTALELAVNQPVFSSEIGTSSEKTAGEEAFYSEDLRGKSTNPLSPSYDSSEESLSIGTEPTSSSFCKGSVFSKGGKLIEEIDVMGQIRPLEVGSPPGNVHTGRKHVFGSDGLRLVPPIVDGEYVLQKNGVYVFQAKGPGADRGPIRIFSRTGKGPGPQWARDDGENAENSVVLVVNDAITTTNGENNTLTSGEKRQGSTESLQPVLKRQRPEEF